MLTYLDDLMIVGVSFEDHLGNLRKTLDRLRSYNLKLKPKKCSLFQTKVLFLGKLVSREGVAVNPGSVSAIKEHIPPRNVQGLQSFLGLANYQREHIQIFLEIASGFFSLVGTKVPFVWGGGSVGSGECSYIALP